MDNNNNSISFNNFTRSSLIEYAHNNDMYIYEAYSKNTRLIVEMWLFPKIDPKLENKQKYFRFRYFLPEFSKNNDAAIYPCGMFGDFIFAENDTNKWYIDADRFLFK